MTKMESKKTGEMSSSSSFFKELNGLPVIQVAGDIYSSTKRSSWFLNAGLTAAEQGLSGLFGRVSSTLGIVERVDELAGDSVCRLKEKYPSLHQSPEELKSKASSGFRSAVRLVMKLPPGRLVVGGIDLVIDVAEGVAGLLKTSDRKRSPRLKKTYKREDRPSEELSEDTGSRILSDRSQQTSPAPRKSAVFGVKTYAREFIIYLVSRLKYVRRYLSGRKKRNNKGSLSPDKEREIEGRRRVSPRKKVPASLLGRLTHKTYRLLGFEPSVGLSGSTVAGSSEAERKRKHEEIVSEDGSDDDLANFDYDNYDSAEDPDYEPNPTEETDDTLSDDLSAESDLEVEEKEGNLQLKEKTETKSVTTEKASESKASDDVSLKPAWKKIP